MAGEATTLRGRLRQVEQWLRANFTPALPTTVRVYKLAKEEGFVLHGSFKREGPTFKLAVHRDLPWDSAIDTLIHEWAHAMAWSPVFEQEETAHEHPDEWGLWMARIYRKYVDEGGYKDASEYSARPWK